MPFPESFMQELKLRNDISDVVSSYVSLKRRGRNMVGLCPFHGEKTPSFTVYPENGSFFCFGCETGGDVIAFIMKQENLDYVEAVRFLAQRVGLDVPEGGFDDSMSRLRMRVYEANREAARYYYSALYSPGGRAGLEYFYSRALSDRTIRHFGLGYADDKWTSLCSHLRSKDFTEAELVAANLAVRRKDGNGIYDRFTSRVMFPIIDLRGNVIAFGGRILTDEKPKYLNTSDTPVFKKSANLFSLNNAKNSGTRTLILCEGYMDVIAVCQAGITNAVATLGTALTAEQAMLMKRYADEVILCYDSDEAGQRATSRAIPILRRAGLNVRVLTIPNGKDPDEFIRSKGADGPAAFSALIEKSGNDVEYRLQKLKQNYNTDLPEGRVGYLEEASKIIAAIDSPIERDVYASRLCKEFELDKGAFAKQLEKLDRSRSRENRKQENRKLQSGISGRNDKINSDHYKKPRSSSAEEALVIYLINNPDSCSEIQKEIKPEQFKNSLMRRFYEYFSERIQNGLEPTTNIAADFSSDEVSKLYQLQSRMSSVAATESTMREYIKVISEESRKLSKDEIASMSPEALSDYLKTIRMNRQ